MASGTLTSFLLFSLLHVLSATAEEKTDSALFTLRQVNDTLHVLELSRCPTPYTNSRQAMWTATEKWMPWWV